MKKRFIMEKLDKLEQEFSDLYDLIIQPNIIANKQRFVYL